MQGIAAEKKRRDREGGRGGQRREGKGGGGVILIVCAVDEARSRILEGLERKKGHAYTRLKSDYMRERETNKCVKTVRKVAKHREEVEI